MFIIIADDKLPIRFGVRQDNEKSKQRRKKFPQDNLNISVLNYANMSRQITCLIYVSNVKVNT